ncbi:MAG: hypothetical protein ACSHXW_14730 [Yoonia sp.]
MIKLGTALTVAVGIMAGATTGLTTGDELINRPDVQIEEIAAYCVGAVRDNYVEPDSDYSCSALL